MAPLTAVRRRAGVAALMHEEGRSKAIQLISRSGHLVGECRFETFWSFYSIRTIRVSRPNLCRGFGRLLQLEAAAWAAGEGIRYKFPTFSFTQEGRRAFLSYPLIPARLLEEKIPIALERQQEALDLPWEASPANTVVPITK